MVWNGLWNKEPGWMWIITIFTRKPGWITHRFTRVCYPRNMESVEGVVRSFTPETPVFYPIRSLYRDRWSQADSIKSLSPDYLQTMSLGSAMKWNNPMSRVFSVAMNGDELSWVEEVVPIWPSGSARKRVNGYPLLIIVRNCLNGWECTIHGSRAIISWIKDGWCCLTG